MPDNTVHVSGTRQDDDDDRIRLGDPDDHWHLHAIVICLPSDFQPYGQRERDGWDCSCGCRWFLPLEGKLASDWGVCSNPKSPRCSLLTFEHMGCREFEAEEQDASP